MVKASLVSGVFMILFLACAAGLAGLDIAATGNEEGWQNRGDVLSGKASHEYEKIFDEALLFNDFATHLWGSIDYTFFHEGKKGVITGKDGWLFTDEEYRFYNYAKKNMAGRVQYVVDVRDALARRGIRLVVVPVPAKARLYADNYPSYNKWIYAAFFIALQKNGVSAVDTLALMMKQKDGLFLKSDTHWSPRGARLVAQNLRPYFQGTQNFKTVSRGTVHHAGDLTRYLPLWPEQFEDVEQFETSAMQTSNDLFGAADIPVALVGTSYSADALWNFAGFLKEVLHADVLNAANPGHGPFRAMRDYMSGDALKTNPPQLVIWEIPERYVQRPRTPGTR